MNVNVRYRNQSLLAACKDYWNTLFENGKLNYWELKCANYSLFHSQNLLGEKGLLGNFPVDLFSSSIFKPMHSTKILYANTVQKRINTPFGLIWSYFDISTQITKIFNIS